MIKFVITLCIVLNLLFSSPGYASGLIAYDLRLNIKHNFDLIVFNLLNYRHDAIIVNKINNFTAINDTAVNKTESNHKNKPKPVIQLNSAKTSMFHEVSTQNQSSTVNYMTRPSNKNSDELHGAGNKSAAFTLNSSQLGVAGPLKFGISRDDLFNYNFNASYVQKINTKLAVAGLIEHGHDTTRIGGTIGLSGAGALKHNLFKLSAEHLRQKLPFSFDSGDITQNMTQNAFGISYQYVFENNFIRDINFTGYYAHAPNKSLKPISLADYINYRNIAGGVSKGFNIGSDLLLTQYTVLSGHIYYDHLQYNTTYTASTPFNTRGMGVNVGIDQLITDQLKVYTEGNIRKLYNIYKIGITYLPPALSNLGLEIAIFGQRTISHNQLPHSNTVALQVGINPEAIIGGAKKTAYKLALPGATSDVVSWTATPAVYMERVFAIAEQHNVAGMSPNITSLSVNTGSKYGGSIIIITGTGFAKANAVNFGNTPSLFVVIDDTHIQATAPAGSGSVHVSVVNPYGVSASQATNLFSYTGVPAIEAIKWGPSGTVIITGMGFLGATAVRFNGVAALAFTVINSNTIRATPPPALLSMTRFSNAANTLLTLTGITSAYAADALKNLIVTVTNTEGTSDTNTKACVIAQGAPPNITSLSKTEGPISGGTNVTITGSNFSGATAVYFGNNPASSFRVVNDKMVTAISPIAIAASTINISIATTNGSNGPAAVNEFKYYAIFSVTGSNITYGAIGDKMTIFGTGFFATQKQNITVAFGNAAPVPAFNITTTSLSVLIPAYDTTGKVTVMVTNGDTQIAALSGGFIYQPKVCYYGYENINSKQSLAKGSDKNCPLTSTDIGNSAISELDSAGIKYTFAKIPAIKNQ